MHLLCSLMNDPNGQYYMTSVTADEPMLARAGSVQVHFDFALEVPFFALLQSLGLEQGPQ